ncbi:1887_t:CDS:2 [Dentiscutata erythropus]|uniref:1887_t:CDS:1 n=1 Tax=Dentiscutata erythropus TaxID=1348616 RepID=A0A9N8WHD3_9GLOM|nr:1887_t:CDS:2 [Dentiscutata erythropus]
MTPMTNFTKAIEKKYLLKKSENIPITTMKCDNEMVPTTSKKTPVKESENTPNTMMKCDNKIVLTTPVIIQTTTLTTNYTRAIEKNLVVKKI